MAGPLIYKKGLLGSNLEIVNFTIYASDSNKTTHFIDIEGQRVGDLILIFFASAGLSDYVSNNNEYLKIYNFAQSGSGSIQLSVLRRFATGTDDVTITTSVSKWATAHIYIIRNAINVLGNSIGGLNSITVNPPNLDAGSVVNGLWLAIFASIRNRFATDYPDDFTDGVSTFADPLSSSTASSIGSCRRFLSAQSLDPNTFTLQVSSAVFVGVTMVIY